VHTIHGDQLSPTPTATIRQVHETKLEMAYTFYEISVIYAALIMKHYHLKKSLK
jgi:hypothetical protein